MKKRYIVIPIAVLMLLTALSAPALANYTFNGFPVTTRANGTVQGGVFIDSVPGAEDTQTGVFDVPTGTITWAYLYTGIWGGTENYSGWVNVRFNGYEDRNGLGPIWLRGQNDTNPNVWGSGHGKHWMYYNVTTLVNAGSTNSATVSKINATDPGEQFDGDPYGIVLVVVYEGGANPKDLRYWINDGSDGLNHITPYDAGTTDFDGTVDTANVRDANLTMVHLTAYDPPVSNGLQFNGNTLDTSMINTNAFDLHSWDVTSYLESSGNDAWYTRCGDYPFCEVPYSDGYINICNAILVVDETEETPPKPDLNVTAITVNPDYDAGHRELFANESNTIIATIKNLDPTNDSNAFNVSFELEGLDIGKVPVSGFAAGASTDVSINWTPGSGGTVLSPVYYDLTVTADCDGAVTETDETNNASTKELTVYNNGYKGKRYTGGGDIETEHIETINGNLIYSKGNSTYKGGGTWSSYTINWTSGDLPVPGGATVKKARLYVYYCWDSSPAGINLNLTFNGQNYTMNNLDAHYKDTKGYGSYYNHKSGTMAYDVTSDFNTAGNIATLTKVGTIPQNIVALYGMLLVVVYEDASEPQRVIWINEECDFLDALGEGSNPGNIGVNETEATAYAPFSGMIESSRVDAATLITVVPAGDSGAGNEDRLCFNSGQWDNVWNGASGENISIYEADVKDSLLSGDNLARIQSRGDYITATNAFLVVGYEEAPELPYLVTYTISNRTITPPQTTEIDVVFSERVEAWIKIEDSGRNLVKQLYHSTSVIDPDPKIWNGTYENGTQVPDGNYYVNVTGTNITSGLSVINNTEIITVTGAAKPDLIVTEISPNCGYLFANESNEICATIKNNDTADAGIFNVSFAAGTFSEQVRVLGGLAAGANITVCINDPTLRNAGNSVTINVSADCNSEVDEGANEGNNVSSITKTVVNNGYKGKRYTGGEDVTTWKTYVLHGNLLYSVGDSRYLSGSSTAWTTNTANWTASDLPVPATATVEEARLYVIYNWDKVQGMPENVSLSFNDILKPRDAFYTDRKGYASSDYPYGMIAYNVTANFSTDGNTAILTNLNPVAGNPSLRGMVLVVIYEAVEEAKRKIVMNEGFDLLYGGSSACTTPEEATAYAPFTGSIDLGDVRSARLITMAPGAGAPNEGELLFNGQLWSNVWNYAHSTQIGIDERDVGQSLLQTTNLAGFQSSLDYMEASNAILVVEYEELPEAAPTADWLGVGDASGRSGTYVGVPINITNVKNGPVQGIRLRIDYNESILNLTNVIRGDLTVNWTALQLGIDKHTITIGTGYTGDAIPNGRSGSVVLLNFHVIGSPGATSPVNMTLIELSNPDGIVGTAPAKNGTFVVPQFGSIVGRITYACNGTGIPGAKVNLTLEGAVVNTTLTNGTGYYNFTGVTPDSYVVNASKLKFWDNSTEVTVIAGETTIADMMLWLKGDTNNDGSIADAGDVVLMLRASVGDIPGDMRYDLNGNGKIGDAGDVVLMLRASVGDIELL